MDRIRLVLAGLAAVAVAAAMVVAVPLGEPAPATAQAGPGADCEDGMAGQYPCDHVDMDSFLPLPLLGQGNGNDIWGWTDPETGNEYAIIGSSTATGFVDVTDPANPVMVGQLPTEVPGGVQAPLWRDVKVADDHAYIVSEYPGHGMQVLDLTKLRDATGSPPTVLQADAVYTGGPDGEDGLGHAHNVFVNEETDVAYPVGSNTCINESDDPENGGLHMVDVSEPTDPTFLGCALVEHTDSEAPNNNYVHDVQCVIYHGPDPDHRGSEICFGSNEDAVVIYDVTDPENPDILSVTTYDTAAYTHQGWLNADHSVFVFGDELDEGDTVDNTTTYTMDVSDLDDPPTPRAFTHDSTAIDHNLYLTDDFMYQSNYAAGLRIFDLEESSLADADLTEVAYFDVFPAGDPTEFVGTWSNYAFFDSDTVVVSAIFDQESGLFVLDPNLTKVSINDAAVVEGDEGTADLTFEVVLEAPTDDPVTVAYATADGTALAGDDYEAQEGTVTIEAGETVAEIVVPVLGDTVEERTEILTVTLSEPQKGLLGDAEATGTIVDFDGPEGPSTACGEEFVPDAGFGDIAGTIHADSIECIAWYTTTIGRGDTDGDGTSDYDPELAVHRAQMAGYLARLAVESGIDLPADPADAFDDDGDTVHHDAINALAAIGVVRGVGDVDGDGVAEFDPGRDVTRAQMASFIARVHELGPTSLPAAPPNAFDDDDGSVHHDAINALADLGVLEGRVDVDDADGDGDTSERLFFPDESVNRAQMASFVTRELGELVADGAALPGGARVRLDESTAAPGGTLTGEVETHKQLTSLTGDGCGLDAETIPVGDDDSFEIEIPDGQGEGDCPLTLIPTTRRGDATEADQSVPWTYTVSVTAAG